MKVTNSKGTEHLINIGERTFNKINELNDEEKLPWTTEELQNKQKEKEGAK